VAAAALCGLGAATADACSPTLGSFRDRMREAPLAVRGKINVIWTERSEKRLAGTAFLTVRNCLRRAKYIRRCPRRMEIPFDEARDGINCPPEIVRAQLRERARKLNFFLLWGNDRDGRDIGVLRRRLDE
jgi:hypothetical protein